MWEAQGQHGNCLEQEGVFWSKQEQREHIWKNWEQGWPGMTLEHSSHTTAVG